MISPKFAVARLLQIQKEIDSKRDQKRHLSEAIETLHTESRGLRKYCPHPKKYVTDGFAYAVCTLCGAD